jgi:serralysin
LRTSDDPLVAASRSGSFWELGPERTITWSISDGFGGEYWLDPAEITDNLGRMFDLIADYIRVDFEYAGYFDDPAAAGEAGSDITYSLDGQGTFTGTRAQAVGFFPDIGFRQRYEDQPGDVFLNINSQANSLPSYAPGSQGWFIALHEAGHALGLKHTFDGANRARPTLESLDLGGYDADWFSVMSYSDAFAFDRIDFDPATPMLLDVIGLQSLYGIDRSTNAGDDTYDLANYELYYTIWDAGGEDTVTAANASDGWTVQLPDVVLSEQIGEKFGFAERNSAPGPGAPGTFAWLEGDIENATGSPYADSLSGNAAANTLRGKAGDDRLAGGRGDDRLHGGPGDNTLDGGPGLDVAVLDRPRAEVSVRTGGDGLTLLAGGLDTELQAVERVAFTDGTLGFDRTPERGYRLYEAAFNRDPDAAGLGYWVERLDDGMALVEVAGRFLHSPEFVDTYGAELSDPAYVDTLYANVLERTPDPDGERYWEAELRNGDSRAEVLVGFAQSEENKANVAAEIDDGVWFA